jgi:hypothetical protein
MFHTLSEAEKMFHNEVKEKKKAASGVHHKTGKNGYVGTMRFPSDIMSRKEKMKYRRSGKVMVSNMYEEILTIDEFNDLETFEKKNRLQYWRNQYTNKEILKAMGIANQRYYNIITELGLPKAPRVDRKKKGKTEVKINKENELKKSAPPAPIEESPVQEIIVDGLHLVFNGTYKAEQIQKQLKKFCLLLEDEPDDFFFELRIMQKQSK